MKKDVGQKKTLGIIIEIIFFIIVIPILLISIIVMIKANKYPDKIPDIFGYKPMIVLSGSMETAIYTGDLVFVKMVDTDTLKENDIIAFRNEANTVTTHRIIEIVNKDDKKYFRTKGDNNNTSDLELVEVEDVEGIYQFKISGLGKVLMFIKEPKSLAILLVIILIIGLIWLHGTDQTKKQKDMIEDEKYKKEFEEFKKRKQEELNK